MKVYPKKEHTLTSKPYLNNDKLKTGFCQRKPHIHIINYSRNQLHIGEEFNPTVIYLIFSLYEKVPFLMLKIQHNIKLHQ